MEAALQRPQPGQRRSRANKDGGLEAVKTSQDLQMSSKEVNEELVVHEVCRNSRAAGLEKQSCPVWRWCKRPIHPEQE